MRNFNKKMKKMRIDKTKTVNLRLLVIIIFAIFGATTFLFSCEKDESGIPSFTTGTPVISKVLLLDTIPSYKDSSILGAEPYYIV